MVLDGVTVRSALNSGRRGLLTSGVTCSVHAGTGLLKPAVRTFAGLLMPVNSVCFGRLDAITTSVDVQSINKIALFSQCGRQLKNSSMCKSAAATDNSSFGLGTFFSRLIIRVFCVSFVIAKLRQF